MVSEKVLDLGCGFKKRDPAAISVDLMPTPQTDLICDLGAFPWPFADNTFDRILCYHVLEHLEDVVGFMREVHRVAVPGAILEGMTPHFSSPYSYMDPTHKKHFSIRMFDMFCDQASVMRQQGVLRRVLNKLVGVEDDTGTFYARALFEKVKVQLRFQGLSRIIGIGWLANQFPEVYEFQGLVRGGDTYFELRVRK